MSNQRLKPVRCDQCSSNKSSHEISWIWISDKLKVVWLENPKVASTSIKTTLGVQPKGAVPGNLSNPYGLRRLPLPRDRLFKFHNYFIFGFCRNPWDRMVSTWKNFTTGKSRIQLLSRCWNIKAPNRLSFKQFVNLVSEHHPKINHHWAHQSAFLPMDKIEIDFIGRFESITKSWDIIREQTGIERNLEWVYATQHDHYSTYYDEETIELVQKLYDKDISLFDYTYEQGNSDE